MNSFPKASLGFFPTPLSEMPRLSEMMGAQLFIKRDDLTGLALGGNKTRKLEYLMGDALSQDCDCVITAGAVQSNHCRQTAAAAAKLDLQCHLVLGGEPVANIQGNLLLDTLLGAEIHWAGEHRRGEDVPALFEQLQAEGKRPYVIPYGGSSSLGAVGFAAALHELDKQSEPDSFTHIVFASSSGGTHAGLIVGKAMLKRDYQIVGVNIDKDEAEDLPFAEQVLELANRTARYIDLPHRFTSADVSLNSEWVGDGYAVVNQDDRDAIKLLAQTEGILLDPVYTGRAMAGLLGMLRSGEISAASRVLFWHTGGAPALFAYAEELT